MNINQIYGLINDVNEQLWGVDAVDTHDLSGLIALGKQFSGDLVGADKFLNKLVDRIGKTVIRTLDVELDFPSLYMDSFSFGSMLQKISVNPMASIQTSEWLVGNNDFTPTFANVVKHDDIHVTYFTDADGRFCFVNFLDMSHDSTECFGIFFDSSGTKRRDGIDLLTLYIFYTIIGVGVLFHPAWYIHGFRVLPQTKPQKDEMHALCTSLINHSIQ